MATVVHSWDGLHGAIHEFELEPGTYHVTRGARVEEYLPHDGPAGSGQYRHYGTWVSVEEPSRMVWKPVVGDGGRFTITAAGKFRLIHGTGHAEITKESVSAR